MTTTGEKVTTAVSALFIGMFVAAAVLVAAVVLLALLWLVAQMVSSL